MNVQRLQACSHEASTLLKAMSNEHRLLILGLLVKGERSVGELVQRIGLSQSALSQHLARLRRDNLVRTRREAQTIYYTVTSNEALAVLDRVYELYCSRQPMIGGHVEEHPHRNAALAHP